MFQYKFVELPDKKVKRIFTVDELNRMFENGILSADESVELVEGEILERSEIVDGELKKAEKIAEVLSRAFGDKSRVIVRPSIYLYDIQRIQPSIAVVKPTAVVGDGKTVKAEDTFFVIEITDIKFNYAENPRARYYGMYEFPEVWFVNQSFRLIEVCTHPDYGYSQCRTYLRNGIIESETASNLKIETSKILY